MNSSDSYNFWKTDEFFGTSTRRELKALDSVADAKEIEDRFYRDLEFGTGGLRGIMGAGTNRMNKYTVGKATTGLAKYLLDNYADAKERGVAIGYDTKNNSEFFARVTADVFSAFGIRVSTRSCSSDFSAFVYCSILELCRRSNDHRKPQSERMILW